MVNLWNFKHVWPLKRSANLSQMADYINGAHQGYVTAPILFAIYVNNLHDHLTTDSVVYARDDKCIAPVTTMKIF